MKWCEEITTRNWYVPHTGIIHHEEKNFVQTGQTYYIPPKKMAHPTEMKQRLRSPKSRTPMENKREKPATGKFLFTKGMRDGSRFSKFIVQPSLRGPKYLKTAAHQARRLIPDKEMEPEVYCSITLQHGPLRICHEGYADIVVDGVIYECKWSKEAPRLAYHRSWLIQGYLYQRALKLPLNFIIAEGPDRKKNVYLITYEDLLESVKNRNPNFDPREQIEKNMRKVINETELVHSVYRNSVAS